MRGRSEEKQKEVSDQAAAKQVMHDFTQDLSRQATNTRMEMPFVNLKEDAAKQVLEFFEALCPKALGLTCNSLKPAVFGIKKGSITFGAERFSQPCFRLATAGTRTVVLVSML